jgi:TolA-binding protein
MYYAILFSILLFFLLLYIRAGSSIPDIECMTNSSGSASGKPGTTYQSYDSNNPMILAEKNAANIEYLEGRLKELQSLEKTFNSLEGKVTHNTDAIKQMSQLATSHIAAASGISAKKGPPPAIKNLSSIAQSASNRLSPSPSMDLKVSPSRADPTAPTN